MKLWLIQRPGGGDYDEANAIVVRAESAEAAKAEALAVDGLDIGHPWVRYRGFTAENIEISELAPDGEPGLILGGYNWA